MNRTQKLAAAMASGAAAQLSGLIISIFLAPYVLKKLGGEMMGVYQFAVDFATYFGLLDFGLSLSLAVILARESPDPASDRFRRLLSTVSLAQAFIGAAVIGLGALAAQGVPFLMRAPADQAAATAQSFSILAVSLGVQQLTRSSAAILVGTQNIHYNSLAKLAGSLVMSGLTVLFLALDWGIVAVGASFLGGALVTASIDIWRASKAVGSFRFAPRYVDWSVMREVAPEGLWMSASTLGIILISSVSRPLTAQVVALSAVTVLTFTQRLFKVSEGLVQQVSQNTGPMLAQLIGEGDAQRLRAAFISVLQFSTLSAVIAAGALSAMNQVFITGWVGRAYHAGPVAELLIALSIIGAAWVHPHRMLLVNARMNRQMIAPVLSEGAASVALMAWLGSIWGIVGVAAGQLMALLAFRAWMLPRLARKVLDGRGAWLAGLRPAAAAAPLVLASAWGIREAASAGAAALEGALPHSAAWLLMAALAGAVGLAVSAGICWRLGFGALIKPRLKHWRKRRPAP